MLIKKQKNTLSKMRNSIKKGFTLIELLIVIAIVSIMTGVSLIGVGDKSARDVETSANRVVANLRSLQNDAINGKVISDGVNDRTICRSELSLVNTEKKYYLKYYDCASDQQVGETIVLYLSAKNENGSIAFTSPDATFSFAAPRGESTLGAIALTSGSSQYYVCIGSSGNIYAKQAGCP